MFRVPTCLLLTAVLPCALCQVAYAVSFDDILRFRSGDATWALSHNPGSPDLYVMPPAFAPTTSGPIVFGAANSSDTPLVGDVNGDGFSDIVIVRPGANNFQWFALATTDANLDGAGELGGGGLSTVGAFGLVAGSEGNLLADINGDSIDDVVTINAGFNWSSLYSTPAGLGGGALSGPIPFGAAGDQPFAGDFDGDGQDDIGVYRPNTGDLFTLATGPGGVLGGGAFSNHGPVGGLGASDSVRVADLNGDGFDDMVLIRQDGVGTIEWFKLINDANGNLILTPPFVDFGADNGNDVPFLADIDGDGFDDLGFTRNSFEHFALLSDGGLEQWNFGVTGDVHLFGTFNTAPSQQIPEPTSIAIWTLVGCGLTAFGYYRFWLKK